MSPETLRQFCGYTAMTGSPLRIDAAGKRWAFATQNQGFLMVPDEGYELSEPAPAIGRSVPAWAESVLAAEFEVPFAALKAFVENGVPLERECPDCIDGTSECPHCEQEMPCDSCGGDCTISRGRDEVLLFGVPFDTRLPQAAYAPDVAELVYAACVKRAALALEGGQTVIVDAVHAKPAEREVLVSSAFVQAAGPEDRARLVSVGRYALRGVARPAELFTLDPLHN